MAFIVADRVQETANSPGTGTVTLLGAVSGFQSFSSGIGANNTTYYVIADQAGSNWEVGFGAINASGTILTRTTVYSSSNGGATVNFATGTQNVWCDYPAETAVIQGTAVNFTSIGATTPGTGAFTTLSASSTVSGAGFTAYLASPPTIGNTAPNTGAFTNLNITGTLALAGSTGTSGQALVSNGASAPTWQSITSTPGGSNTQVQYNSSGSFAGSANMTFNGTSLTLANDASISGLTVGLGGGSPTQTTAVGYQSLFSQTGAGDYNSAFGYQAGYGITTAIQMVAIGRGVMAAGTVTGSADTGVGNFALNALTTGSSNTAIGNSAGQAITTGSYNTVIGDSALRFNTTASNNTAVGYQAGYSNTTGGSFSAFGYKSGYAYKSTSETSGSAFLGYACGLNTTTGHDNTFVGGAAGLTNTTGSFNTALGTASLYSNTTGTNNTAVGYQALYSNTTTNNSVAIGYQAGYSYSGTSGGNNVLVGQSAGYALTTGNGNTFIGSSITTAGSGASITTGSKNTIIGGYSGNQGGLDIRTASNYIVLSDGDGNPYAWLNGSGGNWIFGYGGTGGGSYYGGAIALNGSTAAGIQPIIQGLGNNSLYWTIGTKGNFDVSTDTSFQVRTGGSGGVYLTSGATSWTAVSDETKKDIIEPITDAANKVSSLRAVIGKYKTDEEGTRRAFLIAQDVQAVLPEAVNETQDKDGVVLGLQYSDVIPLLVAAIKEQQSTIESLTTRITALEAK